jgi:hypothetical protein
VADTIILVLWRLMQEDHEFEASLDYMSQKKQKIQDEKACVPFDTLHLKIGFLRTQSLHLFSSLI